LPEILRLNPAALHGPLDSASPREFAMAISLTTVRRAPTALTLLLTLLASLLAADVASAGVPDPRFSTVPSCLPICPSGDRSFTVIVRDVNNAPVIGAVVQVDVSACAALALALCEDCAQMPNYNPATRTFTRVADVNGEATFRICGSITCAGGGVNWARVSADGVPLSNSSFVTTDLDVDLDVDAVDVAIVIAAEGATLPAADQDCNRNIDGNDADVVEAHVGHVCPGIIPAAPTSWGSVKSIYR
jgi:hypothetical protein